MLRRFISVIIAVALQPVAAFAQSLTLAPEAATGSRGKALATATSHMVSAANPLATEAGLLILRDGGSAADAAIAVQLVLGLVEPQSSGLGGGAFILHWNDDSKRLQTYDARETAPAAARPDRFIRDGEVLPFMTAVGSGLSVGVPGVVRGMAALHAAHGKLPWARLFYPAIQLAENGFPVSQRLNLLLAWKGAGFFSGQARSYFFDATGRPRAVGSRLTNPDYARTLRAIAAQGADGFYRGEVAASMVSAVANAARIGGDLSSRDLAGYQVKERAPLCFAYRSKKICGMGAPSSGTLTIAQTLMMIEPMAAVAGPLSRMSPSALHTIAEAEKLAFADRNHYIADPDFVPLPSGYLNPHYIAARRQLIAPSTAMAQPAPGEPPGFNDRAFGLDATIEASGTSHFSIIDSDGNATAITTTIESAFGSGLWASGFLLNNELTDFSMRPSDATGRRIANAVEGGKRPRSSMAPTMVFDSDGNLEIVTGSPGGSRIILFVIKTLIAMIDWKMDAQAAADLINFGSLGTQFEMEYGEFGPGLSGIWPALRLKSFGHEIAPRRMTSGVHTIQRRRGRLEGGADPRREGEARGD